MPSLTQILVAVTAAALVAPWVCDKLEQRSARKDAEAWAKQPGATR